MAYEQYHLDVVLLKESGSGKSKVAIRQAGGTLFELTGEHETPMAALLALAQKVNPHVQPPQEETLPSAAEQYRQANLPD